MYQQSHFLGESSTKITTLGKNTGKNYNLSKLLCGHIGMETRGAGRLWGGLLLRQPAGEIPALLLQHALLGESWGYRGIWAAGHSLEG